MIHGWGTLAYALATFCAWRAYQQSVKGEAFWALITITLSALTVSHALGLFEGGTALLRDIALDQAWYRERKVFQREILAGLALGGAVAACGLWLVLRREQLALRVAALTVTALLVFNLLRAVSLHGIDASLGKTLYASMSLTVGAAAELALLVIAAIAALSHSGRRGRASRKSAGRGRR